MGWNAGYTAMESSVITMYDTGALTKELLEAVMEPHKGSDCDSAGSRDLLTKDGLNVEQVICKVMEPEKYEEVMKHPVWYEGEEPESNHNHGWFSNGAAHKLFWAIWSGHWEIC